MFNLKSHGFEIVLVFILTINWFCGGAFNKSNPDPDSISRTILVTLIVLAVWGIGKFLSANNNSW